MLIRNCQRCGKSIKQVGRLSNVPVQGNKCKMEKLCINCKIEEGAITRIYYAIWYHSQKNHEINENPILRVSM